MFMRAIILFCIIFQVDISSTYKGPTCADGLKDDAFKVKLYVGIILLGVVCVSFPFFFQHIELRDEAMLNDWVLDQLQPRDVSIPIFAIIWSMTIFILVRSVQSPTIFLTFMYGFILL